MPFRGSLYSILFAVELVTEKRFDEVKYGQETALDGSHALAAHSGARDYLARRLADGVQHLESPPHSAR